MSKLSYVFSNGIELEEKRIINQKLQGTATNNKLCFGTVASTYLELTLDNTDGYFNIYSLKKCYINVYNDETKKVTVYIDSCKEKNKIITIKAFDKIATLDKTWTPCKTPISITDFIFDIAAQCNLDVDVSNITTNHDYNIYNIDDLDGKSCRECLSYALEITGNYAYLDADEYLCFGWFDFNEIKPIDIHKLKDYNTDYENSIVDNIYFVRGSKVFSTTSTPNGSIYITKNNPILKEVSSEKVEILLNNLSVKVDFEYLPCSINVADFFTYNIGDVVSFDDYKGNTRYALIGSIVYSGYNSCSITSAQADEQDITPTTTSNSVTNTTSTSTSDVQFFRSVNKTDIKYVDCSDLTEIQLFLGFHSDDSFELEIDVNGDTYKTYSIREGYNLISLMLRKELITDTVMTVSMISDYDLTHIEMNSIYRNCLITDYTDDDDGISSDNCIYLGDIETYFCDSGSNFIMAEVIEGSGSSGIRDFGDYNMHFWEDTASQLYTTNRREFEYNDDGDVLFDILYHSTFVSLTDEDWNRFIDFINGYVTYTVESDYHIVYKTIDKDGNISGFKELENGMIHCNNGDLIKVYAYIPEGIDDMFELTDCYANVNLNYEISNNKVLMYHSEYAITDNTEHKYIPSKTSDGYYVCGVDNGSSSVYPDIAKADSNIAFTLKGGIGTTLNTIYIVNDVSTSEFEAIMNSTVGIEQVQQVLALYPKLNE